MGALIVVGDGPEVLSICSGGFLLDAEFTPAAALRAGEDGRRDHPRRPTARAIARANVHLVPDPDIPTSETGTRHRTAERVARQIDVPVFTISEEMGVVVGPLPRATKRTLEPIPRVLARADQALQILGRYKARLDGVSGALSALEVEDLVTVRDVATVLQRAEMVRRIADEIEGYVVELGADGRLVVLQLEELTGGVEDDRRLVAQDYFVERAGPDARRRASSRLAELADETCSTCARSRRSCSLPHGHRARLLGPATRLPAARTRSRACPRRSPTTSSSASASLPKIMRASKSRSRRGRRRRRGPRPRDQGRPRPRSPRRPSSSATCKSSRVHGRAARGEPGRLDVERITITLALDGVEVAGDPRPARRACRAPGVVLHPDIDGHAPAVRRHGRRLATHGFAVCALEPFARVAGRRAVDRRCRRRAWRASPNLDDEVQLGDLERAADLPRRRRRRERASRVLGFCMGGMQTLKAAATDRFDRAVAVLRDDPHCPRTGGARACASRSTPPPTCARRSRSSAPSTRGRRRPTSRRCATAWQRPARLRDRRRRRCRSRLRPRSRSPRPPRRRRRRRLEARPERSSASSPEPRSDGGRLSRLGSLERRAVLERRRGRGCGSGCGRRSRASRAGRTARSPC